MITQDQLRNLIGSTAYDRDGDKLGKVGQIYYDDDTDQPKWVTVQTGMFGSHENFVPVQGAEQSNDRVTLGYDKAKVKDAPRISEDGHLSVDEEARLYQHYGLDYGDGREAGGDGTPGAVGHDTSGPTTDNAMTRSEERLRVGTQAQETGQARLRKHVVTEQQQAQVPVSHEEVRVTREPITDGNVGNATDGPAISEEEHEVTLHAERPVVDKEAVPVERVRLDTETVQETETVEGQVRREEIEVDDAADRRRRS
ncbi:MAG: PRC and DUF2382 domain-containing protein [Pseudonocardia sp.]|nr:PRC and DUF2382 domain-containing protein [Pseudonocardia sp.]